MNNNAPILNVTSTVTIVQPTSHGAADIGTSPPRSNTNVWIGLASAAGFTLLLAIIGLLFCLKHTRTKHRHRIEDMERRINGLESQVRPPPARRIKRYSTATGTSLGSSWGAWRSKDVKNFQKIRTANQITKNENRKSFGHGWWAFSQQPPNTESNPHVLLSSQPQSGERNYLAPNQSQTAALPPDVTTPDPPPTFNSPRTASPSPTTLRLSAIVECPSPARPDSPTMTLLHHHSFVVQPCARGSLATKEISVIPTMGRSPSAKYSTIPIDKELAVDKEYGSNKVRRMVFFVLFLECGRDLRPKYSPK
jgi:hypothetical protein